MIQFRILLTIAFFALSTTASAATVSGEITTQSIKKPNQTVVVPIKKIVIRTSTKIISYASPAGKEFIEFTIKHKNGVIVAASAKPKATNKISLALQKSFAKNLSKFVVGKKIKNLNIDTVGGASLTTAAFEQYVQKIN